MPTIESIEINNFKSIAESGEVSLQSNITTLVGPNEAGKTSFLEAIRFFGTSGDLKRQNKCDYEDSPDIEANPVIKMVISGVNPSNLSVGSHTNSGSELYNIDREIDIVLEKYSSGKFEIKSEDIERDLQRYESTRGNRFEAIATRVSSLANEIQSEIEEEDIEISEEFQDLIRPLQNTQRYVRRGSTGRGFDALQGRLEKIHRLLRDEINTSQKRRFGHRLRELRRESASLSPAAELFSEEVFTVQFRKNVDLITNNISIDELQQNSSGPYSDLLKFIGLSAEQIRQEDTRERRRLIEEKMKTLSQEFCDAWRQGDIKFSLDLVGDNVHLLVTDESNKEQYIEQRSFGFRYFLTFFLNMMAESNNSRIENQIILLDDPGIHLHPKRKKDLLEALERLSERNQIIYTTHSPYMIDTSQLNRIRIVTSEEGHQRTTIESNFDEAKSIDEDSLEPVRGALGANYSDSLFTGGRTLLVEGYTDRIYINRFSNLFHENNMTSLPNDIGILDMGGDGSWDKYTRLLTSEDYEFALILDGDKAKENSLEKIESSEYIDSDQVLFIDEVIDVEGDKCEIEDLFSDELFVNIVSSYYDIETSKLDIDTGYKKSLWDQASSEIDQIIGTTDKELERLNKGDISDYIDEKIQSGDIDLDDLDQNTISNFERMFSKITELFVEKDPIQASIDTPKQTEGESQLREESNGDD